MEGLGVEHGVGVDGHEQVGVTNLPETVHLRVALALIGGALPAGVDAGQRRLPDEPVPLCHIGALGGAVVDDVDLGRRRALVQQGGEHPHHDVGILVVERHEHGDPMRLAAADDAPLETGHHELHGHDHEEDIEGPHDPRVQDVVPTDQHPPAEPPHHTEGHNDGGQGPTGPHECPGQPGGVGRSLSLIRRRHRGAHGDHPTAPCAPLLAVSLSVDRPEPCPALEQQLDREAGQQDDQADQQHERTEGPGHSVSLSVSGCRFRSRRRRRLRPGRATGCA